MTVSDIKKLISEEKYSNLSNAFFKLHPFNFLEKEVNKREYIEKLLSNVDYTQLNEALKRFQNGISKTVKVFNSRELKAKIGYRFVIGMGYPSLIENGFLFHFTYGVPYIPGESVKGLVRNMFLLENFGEENLNEVEKKLLEETYEDKNLLNRFKIIFGTKESEGKVVFFDAYPLKLKKDNFVVDVMNPHYESYYRTLGKEPPKEWDNPIPIFFLALENTEFVFNVGVSKDLKNGEEYLKEIMNLLKYGLETFGIGSKKRKGYGWFEV